MPEEHTGQLGFEYAWKELLARSRNAGANGYSNEGLDHTDSWRRKFFDMQHICI